MRPEPLFGMFSNHLFNGLLIPGRVHQRVGVSVAGALLRDLLINLDHVADAIRLAHDEHRDDGGTGHHCEAIEAAGRCGHLAEKWDPDCLGALRVLIERDANDLAALERSQHLARSRMLADYLHTRALADERHQVVARQEALRVMHEANLEAVQRMTHRQQLEAAEVRRQDERALARVPRRQIVPDVQPIVSDAPRDPAIEESAEANVFGARASEVDVGRAQDALSLRGAFFGERDFEIADSNSPVTNVEAMENQTAGDSQFIQDEIRQEAERMEHGDQHPEDQPILESQLNTSALRLSKGDGKV